jgi:hypothetical protein
MLTRLLDWANRSPLNKGIFMVVGMIVLLAAFILATHLFNAILV